MLPALQVVAQLHHASCMCHTLRSHLIHELINAHAHPYDSYTGCFACVKIWRSSAHTISGVSHVSFNAIQAFINEKLLHTSASFVHFSSAAYLEGPQHGQ
jgi:hypothetical protein